MVAEIRNGVQMPHNVNYPSTVKAAVRLLFDLVPTDQKAKIAATDEGELVTLHFGFWT